VMGILVGISVCVLTAVLLTLHAVDNSRQCEGRNDVDGGLRSPLGCTVIGTVSGR